MENISKELNIYNPTHVICSAGLTGTPNITWCETHKTETIETNITYQLTLAHLCREKNIHLIIIGSGAIFTDDKFYNEYDEGNYYGNFYSKCRIFLENIVKNYENVLYVRINYPISKNISPRNLITKLLSYENIENNYITLTYLDELIPILIKIIEDKETGICNLVNKDAISLNEIIQIYEKTSNLSLNKKIIEKNSNRSGSKLEQGKLMKYNTMNVKEAVEKCIIDYLRG